MVSKTTVARIAASCTCLPTWKWDNLRESSEFMKEEIRKVTGTVGVSVQRMMEAALCIGDLGIATAQCLLG